MKLLLHILLLILILTLTPADSFCQGTVSKTGRSFHSTSSVGFNFKVIKTLSISKNSQMIELSSFEPGEERIYNEAEFSSDFDISGDAGKDVAITVRMYCSNKEIVVKEAVCQYKEGNIWKSHRDDSFYDDTDLVFDFVLNLDNSGARSLRIYPKRIEAGAALNTGNDVVFLIIEVNCEYKDM